MSNEIFPGFRDAAWVAANGSTSRSTLKRTGEIVKIELVELDLPELSAHWGYLALVAILALVGLGWLGKVVTPEGGRVLSWSEWEIRKARQTYRGELDQLQRDAEDLAGLLGGPSDAVRAQVVADRIAREGQNGQAALEVQRSAVGQAAEAVRAWAIGSGTQDEARAALQKAITALQAADQKESEQ